MIDVEVVPAHRERHRHARPHPRAVGGDDGAAADAGRVDEHLAAAVVLHELGRGDVGVEGGGAHGDGAGGGGHLVDRRRRRRSGTNTCTPLAPLVFTAPVEADVVEDLVHEPGRLHGLRERVALGRVEVEDEVGHVVGVATPCTSAGWYSIARWLANHSSVRRSLQSA